MKKVAYFELSAKKQNFVLEAGQRIHMMADDPV
jgi:hypothetical protein